MSFRARLLLTLLPVALVPLILFGTTTRRTVTEEASAQHEARVAELAEVVEGDLTRLSESIRQALARVARAIAEDPDARGALLGMASGDPELRAYLLDHAAGLMPLVGLDVLRIQAGGRIVSSGHFRNEYDLSDGRLAEALARLGNGPALTELPTPEGPIVALVRRATFRLGADSIALVGGLEIDHVFLDRLERGSDPSVRLFLPGEVDPSAPEEGGGRAVSLPFVVAGSGTPVVGTSAPSARFVVVGSADPLRALLSRLDRNLLGASVGAVLLALVLAIAMAAHLGAPIEELARRAASVNPERMRSAFATPRRDEVGDLSRALDGMIVRLRAGTAKLREAERRAATGDLARQVHHDVRNGIIPIRNTFAHLLQVAEKTPERTAETLLERRRTLDSGIAHLHALAGTYARLSPSLEREACDVNEIARQAAADTEGAAASPDAAPRIDLDLADGPLVARAHPPSLRRLLDNLLSNAVESLDPRRTDGKSGPIPTGAVSVRTRRLAPPGASGIGKIEITVADTGRGMTSDERTRAFEDFFTTRPGGTGLGLSIVRRIVLDLQGSVELESAPGKGTRVTVTFPEGEGRDEP